LFITVADKPLQLQVQSLEPTTSCHARQHWYNRTPGKCTTKHNTRFSTGTI